jgi:hypothetical protein
LIPEDSPAAVAAQRLDRKLWLSRSLIALLGIVVLVGLGLAVSWAQLAVQTPARAQSIAVAFVSALARGDDAKVATFMGAPGAVHIGGLSECRAAVLGTARASSSTLVSASPETPMSSSLATVPSWLTVTTSIDPPNRRNC